MNLISAMTRDWLSPAITLSAIGLFWLAVVQQSPTAVHRDERPTEVVVSGPLQILLYGGDRFLAADVEAIRATASATASGAQLFRMRAHEEVSRLNPCHEDNYWIGNATLSWGGAEGLGFDILRNAMHCRFWDEWPAFFYGFNQHFFLHNLAEAQRILELAAERSPKNAATFRTFSITLAAGQLDSARMALKMLEEERDKARDPTLREMLDKRVGRLEGLLLLRDAQSTYEQRFGRQLTGPQELLDSGLLKSFPTDPLKLGYEFRDHTFQLRRMQLQ